MGHQRPGRIDEVGELRPPKLGAVEGLPRLVDVDAGNFHEVVLRAERLHTPELGGGVARRHVGHGEISQLPELDEELVEIIVLELLGLLVARGRFADIAQVGVGGNRSDGAGEGDGLADGDAFALVGLDENSVQETCLEHVDEVVDGDGVGRVGEEGGDLGCHLYPEILFKPGDEAPAMSGGIGGGPRSVIVRDLMKGFCNNDKEVRAGLL